MQEASFEETVEQLIRKDQRYQRDAYLFLRDALEYTQKQVAKENRGGLPHVTGRELLQGIREYALEKFGPMTMTVFDEWGIHSTADFGEIVFSLVEIGQLRKTEKDTRDDFAAVYDFQEVFRKPFLPLSKTSSTKPESNPAGA